jgi:aminopeptidase-like protein
MAEKVNSAAPPMYQWATDLFPIHRSLTGDGVRETLSYIQKLLANLQVHEVPSGTKAFDWTVPKEWVFRYARLEELVDVRGEMVLDLRPAARKSNLHIVQYSTKFMGRVSREELEQHLHSLPDQPDAIPYVTSYYKDDWGFCLTQRQRDALKGDSYFVDIEAELKDGHLTYGELIIPGAEPTEVLLSTNICHPSMGNNELSGPVVVTALAQWLASAPRRHTYRILFLPETIGALVYLSRPCDPGFKIDLVAVQPNIQLGSITWVDGIEGSLDQPYMMLHHMRHRTIAGYQVVCCGDERGYSYLFSRKRDTLADRAALSVLRDLEIAREHSFEFYSFANDRGSDERQWCAPGVDLPVGSIMRSKYGEYPEYHTSLDDLSFISQEGLEGSLKVYQRAIEIIEANRVYKATCIGEPQLGPRGLYHAGGTKEAWAANKNTLNVLAYADGRDLMDLAETIGVDVLECARIAEQLKEHGLLE